MALVTTFFLPYSFFVTVRGSILTGGYSIEKFLVNMQGEYSFVRTHIVKKPSDFLVTEVLIILSFYSYLTLILH